MRLAVLVASSVFAAMAQEPPWPRVQLVPVVHGLESPVDIQNAHDGTWRLFIVEQAGRIRVLKDGALLPEPFLDIRAKVRSGGERGLLGLAFPRDFAATGRFYVNYTEGLGAPDLRTVIARYRVSADNPDRADPLSEERILVVNQPFDNHNAGQLAFSPVDGMLYVGMGDGGSAYDPFKVAQDPAKLLGKMLRLDVKGDAVPAPEIWALGLRNPWRYSFDAATGDLYIGDVGQDTREEVDFQPAGSSAGVNYGWSVMEASLCVQPGCRTDGLTLPVFEYGRDLGGTVIGGYVYRGQGFADWRGTYFLADFLSGRLWALRHTDGGWTSRELAHYQGWPISTFGVDEGGEIYFAVDDAADGAVYKLADLKPATRSDMVANAATGQAGAVAGSRVNVYGWGIAMQPDKTSVLFDDLPAQIETVGNMAGSEYIVAVVPAGIAGRGKVSVTVVSGEERSVPVDVNVPVAQPGVFGFDYAAGAGGTVTVLATGISGCAGSMELRMGDQFGAVEACSASHWFAGTWDLVLRVPGGVSAGEQNAVVRVDGVESPAFRLRVK